MAEEEENYLLHLVDDDENSSDSSFSRSLSKLKKSTTKRLKPSLKCAICGDDAYGYNFDVVSCESCKAFFRRNALRPQDKFRCRGNGPCEVTISTRKRCKKCRIDKCFQKSMRKEWILSEEDKQRKKHKIEENRRLKQSHKPIQPRRRRTKAYYRTEETSSGNESPPLIIHDDTPPLIIHDDTTPLMSQFDWSKIEQVRTAYNEAIAYNQVTGVPSYPATQPIHSTVELIRIPTYLSSLRLITYFRKIPEFELFDSEDRVTLIKHNLLAAVFMHIVLIYDPIADTYHEHNTQDPIFQGKDWIDTLGEEFYHDLTATAKQLIQMLEYDRIIIKLLLIIILFTKAFCGYDIIHEPSLNNPLIVLNAHNIYVEILYKYCLHQYGFNRAINLFKNLFNPLLTIQRLSIQLKHLVHSNVDAALLSPLMQSVLQLSDATSSS
ncbi:unnamed protein product [Rotaria sordida]|uniref:Nuclear receptor domain-containing protein n=1 Tax=Rotaria sordida TaxID=392033 RepID=A0A819BNR2_9BILA|nr:unnamed protein product [Rotaria sordida]CAF3805101.1 unnamed protein product [Rotaria sordida]